MPVAAIPDDAAILSITTPWAGTVTEYSAPSSLRSSWAQRSRALAGADFIPRSVHWTVIFAGAPPRFNNSMGCPPLKSGLAHHFWSHVFTLRRACFLAISLFMAVSFAL